MDKPPDIPAELIARIQAMTERLQTQGQAGDPLLRADMLAEMQALVRWGHEIVRQSGDTSESALRVIFRGDQVLAGLAEYERDHPDQPAGTTAR